jgi:pimeloyl-ACP methyl ester carboxylesterase
MIGQIRAVLGSYEAAGGEVRMEMIEGAAHGPHFDHAAEWQAIFLQFLQAH